MNKCQEIADMSLESLERWCDENDGEMIDFFDDGGIYGSDKDGNLLVGYGVYGSANVYICKDHVDCGGYSSAKFSPQLEKGIAELRSLLENS